MRAQQFDPWKREGWVRDRRMAWTTTKPKSVQTSVNGEQAMVGDTAARIADGEVSAIHRRQGNPEYIVGVLGK